MENQGDQQSLFELKPAIDTLEQLWRSTWSTTGQLMATYFERLRYVNEQLFELAGQMPGRNIWSDIEAASVGAAEEVEDTAEEVVEDAASYPVPASKRQRRTGASMH